VIRQATAADLDDLARLETAAFGAGAWSRTSLAGQLEDPGSWLALDLGAGELHAYIALRLAADEAELLRIGTHPQHRRRGVAQRLMERGRAWARAEGAARLFLEVSALNHGALALYTGQGLAPCGRRRGYYGPGDDALLMAQQLVEAT
jgi:[ribosomal protein S18]-alanine N-acetyltransferase